MAGIIMFALAIFGTVAGCAAYIGYDRGYRNGWADRDIRLSRRSVDSMKPFIVDEGWPDDAS